MAKVTKTEEFPSFEDWEAPFDPESDDFDPDKVARLVYNARKAEHKLKAKAHAQTEQIEELEQAVTVYKEADEASKRDGESEVQALQRQIEALKKQNDEKPAPKGDDLAIVRLELALEHGLTKRQAARLVGEDRDALEEDAEALIEELGLNTDPEAGTERVENEHTREEHPDAEIKRRPRSRAAGDPEPRKAPNVDVLGKIDELIPR